LQAAQQLIPDASQIEHTVKQGVFELYKVKNETSEAQWVVNKISSCMFSFTLNDKSKICINEDSNFKAPGVIL
jgi:hypothetical protein